MNLDISSTPKRRIVEVMELVRDIDALEPILEAITAQIMGANRADTLDALLESWGLHELAGCGKNEYEPLPGGKVVIIGESKLNATAIIAIAEQYGIARDRLELCLDYQRAKKYNFKKLQYASNYSVVLVGPMPHKTAGAGDYSSAISAMEHEEGYPPIIRICNSNELKITKHALREALQQ